MKCFASSVASNCLDPRGDDWQTEIAVAFVSGEIFKTKALPEWGPGSIVTIIWPDETPEAVRCKLMVELGTLKYDVKHGPFKYAEGWGYITPSWNPEPEKDVKYADHYAIKFNPENVEQHTKNLMAVTLLRFPGGREDDKETRVVSLIRSFDRRRNDPIQVLRVHSFQ